MSNTKTEKGKEAITCILPDIFHVSNMDSWCSPFLVLTLTYLFYFLLLFWLWFLYFVNNSGSFLFFTLIVILSVNLKGFDCFLLLFCDQCLWKIWLLQRFTCLMRLQSTTKPRIVGLLSLARSDLFLKISFFWRYWG